MHASGAAIAYACRCSNAGYPVSEAIPDMSEAIPFDPETATALPAEMSSPAPPPPPAPVPTASAAAPAAPARIGILLVNLGTPDEADAKGVRRYLKEFLADPRVIEDQGLVWQLVLNGIILPLRPRRKARDYRKIWNEEANESPLKTVTRAQAQKLGSTLEPLGAHIQVDWAMRYGNPSIASRMGALVKDGCERILVIPLYPQYSAATTATVCDEVFRILMALRRQPTVRIAAPYYDDRVYIEALAASTSAELAKLAFEPDLILASYHGMPASYVRKGDPYYAQCARTTELLRAELKLNDRQLIMTFQSRFGRAEWLQPYTIATVKHLAKNGVKNLVVITPGFAADCLETLEEIAHENARVFQRHGGENFVTIPCLNDSAPGMLVLWQMALRELKGWA
jgi:protoporphyrin/coproporphyrin ferrochelatase